MTHTYHHVFANGTKATALIGTDPVRYEVEWDGPGSRKLLPEYRRWRQFIFEDFAKRTGRQFAVVERW